MDKNDDLNMRTGDPLSGQNGTSLTNKLTPENLRILKEKIEMSNSMFAASTKNFEIVAKKYNKKLNNSYNY